MDEEDVRLTDQTAEGESLSSVGEEKVLAVMFADIRGFTSFAEELPAYDVVHVLNRFFRHMGRAISQNGGSIHNYMGDGLMALFGLDDGGQEALNSVKAGLAMLEEMERLKPYVLTNCGKSFDVRIGVHCGPAVVGPIGSGTASQVTAIGDTVNLASRIESANKLASTRFLISQETYDQVRDAVLIGGTFEFPLPGKSGTYRLYEPIGLKG
jgi:adenylate cyclase